MLQLSPLSVVLGHPSEDTPVYVAGWPHTIEEWFNASECGELMAGPVVYQATREDCTVWPLFQSRNPDGADALIGLMVDTSAGPSIIPADEFGGVFGYNDKEMYDTIRANLRKLLGHDVEICDYAATSANYDWH